MRGEYVLAKPTLISRRTFTCILDDKHLRLYIDADMSDERMADALNETAIDLSDGFENRIRSVVRDELQSDE